MKQGPDAPRSVDRRSSMDARPFALEVLEVRENGDGSLSLVVERERSAWQRWLGAPTHYRRTFELDRLGREVYEACDGKRKVSTIARGFAAKHRVSIAEAEMAVASYLRTLIGKGLIAMEVRRKGR